MEWLTLKRGLIIAVVVVLIPVGWAACGWGRRCSSTRQSKRSSL